ncbi:hypothetical protein AVEN_174148-1 [Araneus ventricosus]|uniref:Uncharacterized protein n=1 Tax=Araneus ventricosus TaxID=182803 RepID=A0A4Y2EPT3_ARAVE|nr:hypothetical protein AVEN_174148-1 [Araneus ventricosus]
MRPGHLRSLLNTPSCVLKRDDTLRWSVLDGTNFLAQSKKQYEEERLKREHLPPSCPARGQQTNLSGLLGFPVYWEIYNIVVQAEVTKSKTVVSKCGQLNFINLESL